MRSACSSSSCGPCREMSEEECNLSATLMYSWERDEEGLPVGGIVLQQLMQQLVVLDMGKISPAELLMLAVELVRQVELFGVAPTSQNLSIKSMTVEWVNPYTRSYENRTSNMI
jgi:hypothetical protein